MTNPSHRVTVAVTVVCAIIAAALFLVPAWIIQPFRPQAQDQLAFALAIRRIAPVATILLFALGVACVLYARPRRWSAVMSVLAIVVTAVAAAAVRVNYFELMFHPNPTPQFVGVSDAKVEPDDMVMVARIGNAARAYPVRIMAYHHLLNDTVAGVPILPTY